MLESRLPLVTFYLTERCNSRCVSCDYWRHGRRDASLDSVRQVLPDLARLGTRVALLSGGEPLLNPEWQENAASYQAIRGLDAFDKVCEGVRAVVARGARVGLRVTLQRANYRALPEFVS